MSARLAVWLCAAAVAGCAALAGLSDYEATPPADDASPPADDGGSEDSAPDATDAPPPEAACTAGATLYVSSTAGEDGDGTACRPLRTIGAALALARREAGVVRVIDVCAGTYAEQVVLDIPVSLSGGYACATWTRAPGYGYPTFDRANETIIFAPSPQITSLVLSGAGVADGVAVDGFTVQGPDSSSSATFAVQVGAGAGAPSLHDLHIVGGAGTSSGACGSYGLDVEAPAEITRDLVSGGNGHSSGACGSVAISSVAASHVHDNTIFGGSGVSTATAGGFALGSIGVSVSGVAALVDHNVVSGGSGNGSANASVGILVINNVTRADVSANFVEGGSGGGCATSGCLAIGVYVEPGAGASARVAGNRIYGGDAPTAAGVGQTMGILVGGTDATEIVNNFVLAGNKGGSAMKQIAYGIYLTTTTNAQVLANTIATSRATEVHGAIPLVVVGGGSNVVADNILAEGASSGDLFLYFVECLTPVFAQFRNNLFLDNGLGTSAGLVTFLDADSGCTVGRATYAASTIPELEALLYDAGVDAQGDLALFYNCAGAGPGCIVDPSCDGVDAQACRASLFARWTESSAGYTELADGGWPLAVQDAGDPRCAVLRGGVDLTTPLTPKTPPVTLDAFGKSRVAGAFSVGADQEACR